MFNAYPIKFRNPPVRTPEREGGTRSTRCSAARVAFWRRRRRCSGTTIPGHNRSVLQQKLSECTASMVLIPVQGLLFKNVPPNAPHHDSADEVQRTKTR